MIALQSNCIDKESKLVEFKQILKDQIAFINNPLTNPSDLKPENLQLEFRRLIWESLKPDQNSKEKKKYKLGFRDLEQPKPIKRPASDEPPIEDPIKPKR